MRNIFTYNQGKCEHTSQLEVKHMNLKFEREKKLLTQQQLADMINVDRTLISKIEGGNATPSVPTAKKIAQVLNFNWTLFYENNDDFTPTGTNG